MAPTNSNICILHASNRIHNGNYNQHLYWILGYWLSHINIPCISSCRIIQRINESQVRNHNAGWPGPGRGFLDVRRSQIQWETGIIWSFFSGYKFIDIPCLIGNEFHDTHHKLTNCNYGSYGYFDAIFGSHVLNKKKE